MMRLFLADDSALLRERLIETLSEFKEIDIVGQAKNAHQAVKSIKLLHPDVVILDIRMPDGNGIEVLETIKKDNFSTKVIIFTNYPYPQYRKKCLDAGADYFLYKVTEYETLIQVMKKLSTSFRKAKIQGDGTN